MTSSIPPDREKTLLKALFWCLAAPMMALMFFRLFFVLFRFVYGTVLILLLGQQAAQTVLILSVATALIFTVGAIGYAYKQLKIHIIGQ
ncbi:hypothetical protein [Desulfosarcina sp.]|uniref:hypothetical protein n=1 Tax=Desulfosarcina sp. TaxID=2027861 RepID=UPI0035665EC1